MTESNKDVVLLITVLVNKYISTLFFFSRDGLLQSLQSLVLHI
jgi:hypothetical protein